MSGNSKGYEAMSEKFDTSVPVAYIFVEKNLPVQGRYNTGLLSQAGKADERGFQGKHYFFNVLGQLREVIEYVDGLRHGDSFYYHQHLLCSIDTFDKGKHTRRREVNRWGMVIRDIQRDGELKHGTATVYFPNGRVQARGKYKKGKKHGRWTHFTYGGFLWQVVRYKDGLRSGLNTYFSNRKSGRIGRLSYRMGKLHGWCYYWDTGKLQLKKRYERGLLVEAEKFVPEKEYQKTLGLIDPDPDGLWETANIDSLLDKMGHYV
jgi:antitoxin component YwqK of YwqJK toxin-antitoxin module